MAALSVTSSVSHQSTSITSSVNFQFPKYWGQGSEYNPGLNSTYQSQSVQHRFSPRISSPVTCCSAKNTVPDVQFQDNNPTSVSGSQVWSEFSTNVSGEWDGFGADFSREGVPVELPESVVPEAYREWEVKVYDWQTQCPTLADPEKGVMMCKVIKLLPTVGCEADAATQYSIQERTIGGMDSEVTAFAYQSSGCYVAAWPAVFHGTHRMLELEHCFVNPQDRESRVRIIQVLRVDGTKVELQNIRVFCEQWYGPFRNGDQLGGCAIRDSGFASTAALKASEVVGMWQGTNAAAHFDAPGTNSIQAVEGDGMLKSIREEGNLKLLPRQLWCGIGESEATETYAEVGWLFDPEQAITSKCIFSRDGKLKIEFIGKPLLHDPAGFAENINGTGSQNMKLGNRWFKSGLVTIRHVHEA